MRKTFSRALVICAIATVASFGADNSLGAWKMNLAKSKYTPAPMPLKSYTVMREAAPGGVKVTITGERIDGAKINAGYDTISIKQVDASTFTYETKKTGGKFQFTGRLEVSKDGKTLTLSSKGTDADGKAMALTLVTEKQ